MEHIIEEIKKSSIELSNICLTMLNIIKLQQEYIIELENNINSKGLNNEH